MKKWFKILITSSVMLITLTGCNIIDQLIGERANGIIVYGNKAVIEEEVKPIKAQLKSMDLLETKLLTFKAKKILIINQDTATNLLNQGLFREIKEDQSVILQSLSPVTKNQSILFAKEPLTETPDVFHSNMELEYTGNIIIGSSRHYVDAYLLVENSVYEELSAEIVNLGILSFEQASKSEHSMQYVKNLAPQLVTLTVQK